MPSGEKRRPKTPEKKHLNFDRSSHLRNVVVHWRMNGTASRCARRTPMHRKRLDRYDGATGAAFRVKGRREGDGFRVGFSWRATKRWNPLALHHHCHRRERRHKVVYRRQLLNLICAQLCRSTKFKAGDSFQAQHRVEETASTTPTATTTYQHKNASLRCCLASPSLSPFLSL